MRRSNLFSLPFSQRIFSLLLVLAWGFSPLMLEAQVMEIVTPKDAPKQGTVHVVKKGETLFRIAKTYDLTVNELKALNQLRGDVIFRGQKLIVALPDSRIPTNFREDPAHTRYPEDIASRNRAYEVPETAKIERKTWYKVMPGETIYSIAEDNNVQVEEIRAWNALSDVREGQTIIVDRWYEDVKTQDMKGHFASAQKRAAGTYNGTGVASNSDFDSEPTFRPAVNPDEYEALNTTRSTPNRVEDIEDPFFTESEVGSIDNLQPEAGRRTYNTRSDRTKRIEDWDEVNPEEETFQPYPGTVASDARMDAPRSFFEEGSYVPVVTDMVSNPFYAAHPNLPVGTRLKMRIPNNPGFVEVTVVAKLSRKAGAAIIGLSPACMKVLDGAGNPPTVRIER
ncbi:MAG: LysM peptidoglycan-binding domain-containing protein [Bacteroidota bacterium]